MFEVRWQFVQYQQRLVIVRTCFILVFVPVVILQLEQRAAEFIFQQYLQ